MVPFSAARQDHVYQPSSDTVIKYYDSAGSLHEAKWFAKVHSYATPGLLLFATREDAAAYVSTGEVSKALPFSKAGPVSSPAVPKFHGQSAHTVDLESAGPSKETVDAWFGRIGGQVENGRITYSFAKEGARLIDSFFLGYRPSSADGLSEALGEE